MHYTQINISLSIFASFSLSIYSTTTTQKAPKLPCKTTPNFRSHNDLPQLPDSLHRLVEEKSHRPPDYLSGHAHEDGKWENRDDYVQEVDLVRGICGAHGGHETVEEGGVHRTRGRGLRGEVGKRVDGVSTE